MKILAIDTSSSINTIGLIDGEQILADFAWKVDNNSLETMISNIDFILANAGLTLNNIDGFGVGIGPGSWTGVRIAVTVAKIFAFATNKPICGISSLDTLAYNAKNVPVLICPIINATKEIVYAAFYDNKNNNLVRVGDYYVGSIRELLMGIKEPILFLGNGAQLHSQVIIEMVGSLAIHSGQVENIQRGSVLALLAVAHLKSKGSDNLLSLAPLYSKESAAQALLSKRSGHS